MDTLINKIEAAKPFFDKVSRNKYLKAIRDGFMSAMPVVLFSSIFLLIAYVPNIFGFYWPAEVETAIMKPYNYSMGILAVLVAGSTSKNLTDSMNRELPVNRQINNISTFMAGAVGLLVMAADPLEKVAAILAGHGAEQRYRMEIQPCAVILRLAVDPLHPVKIRILQVIQKIPDLRIILDISTP